MNRPAFKIGHWSQPTSRTGCTVILCPPQTVGAAEVRGLAPGTRELALLRPETWISHIHAVVLSGGSAFGLAAAQGVMKVLKEQGIGHPTSAGPVPLVPAAVIYDRNVGDSDAYPDAHAGAEAARAARVLPPDTGRVGVGTGATVGKWAGMAHAQPAGVGYAETCTSGFWVGVLSVVNAVGDVLDPRGHVVAGAKNDRGFLREQGMEPLRSMTGVPGENTTHLVLMTSLSLNKRQAYLVARHLHDAIARRIDPPHTRYDGDVTFVLAAPAHPFSPEAFDALLICAQQTAEQAIIEAVRQ